MEKQRVHASAVKVHGGHDLRGTIHTSGFKHSLVTIVAASVASSGTLEVSNCPDIAETCVLAELITGLGGITIRSGDVLTVNASGLRRAELDPELAGRIHGAVYLLPGLLGRFGRARVCTNGGCQIGSGPGGRRPMEQYISVLERFGAKAVMHPSGDLEVVGHRLSGCQIDLLDYTRDRGLRTGNLYSGATKMAILTAAIAHGVTVLHHLYPKPDVTDLVDALRGFGADIDTTSAGSLIVYGRGNGALCHDVCHTLVPDLIEVVTWICAGVVLSSSPLRITGTDMARACSALAPELAVLDEMGVQFDMSANEIMVHPAQALRAVDVTAASHGVFSDNQPFLALLAAYAHGTSKITDTVWPDRFGYLSGLVALGVDMCRRGPSLRVHGPCPPKKPGQRIHATDLRAAAVLLLAALAVPGPTTITGTHHLARGYPDLSAALCAFGADIQPMEEDRQPVPGMPAHPGERQTELARCVHCGDPPPPIHTDPTDTDIPTFRR